MTAHDVVRHNLHAALLPTDSSVALDECLPSQRSTACRLEAVVRAEARGAPAMDEQEKHGEHVGGRPLISGER